MYSEVHGWDCGDDAGVDGCITPAHVSVLCLVQLGVQPRMVTNGNHAREKAAGQRRQQHSKRTRCALADSPRHLLGWFIHRVPACKRAVSTHGMRARCRTTYGVSRVCIAGCACPRQRWVCTRIRHRQTAGRRVRRCICQHVGCVIRCGCVHAGWSVSVTSNGELVVHKKAEDSDKRLTILPCQRY